jgi:hypothetical protein
MTEQTEASPQVPPPAGTTRKPTAKEVADQALEGVLALQASLAELEARIAAAPAGTVVAPAESGKVADLDRDLTALADFVNELSGKVSALPTTGAATPDAEALGSNLEALRASMIAAVASLRDQDVHLGQELGSLGRAVSTLTERVAELDARPQPAEQGTGEDGVTARWNELARQVDRVLTEQREDTQRNLGALTERLDVLADAVTGGQPSALLASVVSRSAEPAPAVPKVYGAMVQVMREVREVGKNGVGPQEAGRYAYRKLDDAVDAVGTALRTVGLLLVPVEVVAHEIHQTTVSTNNGPCTWTTATVTMRWRYIHPEDGSHQDVVMAGEGRDMGDKATGKANSNAWKNALVQSLNIPVQGMPEVEDDHPVIGAGQGPAQPQPTEHDRQMREHAPQAQQQQPQGGQLTKDEAARRTVQALNNLGAVPPAERRAKLDAIAGYARDQGLTDLVVDGVKVSQVIITVLATLVPDHAFSAPPGQRGPIATTPQRVMERAEAEVQAAQAAQVNRLIQERDPNSTAAHVSGMVAEQAAQRVETFNRMSHMMDSQPQQFPLPTDEPPWDSSQTGVGTEYPHGYQHPGDFS